MVSRDGSEQRMPSLPMAMPSVTVMVLNSTGVPPAARMPALARSEEHTSELQSLMRISYAVFCLKKKKHHKQQKSLTYEQIQQQPTIEYINDHVTTAMSLH